MMYQISLFKPFVKFDGKRPLLPGNIQGLEFLEVTGNQLLEIALTTNFIGGKFKNGFKVNDDWESSNLLILDIDHASEWELDIFRLQITNIRYAELATQSDSIEQPKRRFIIPLKKVVSDKDYMIFLIKYFTTMSKGDHSAVVLHRHWATHKKILKVNKGEVFDPENVRYLYAQEQYNKKLERKFEPSSAEWSLDDFEKKMSKSKKYNKLFEDLSTKGNGHTSLTKLVGIVKKMGYGIPEIEEVARKHLHTFDKQAEKTIRSFK
jgi:hypothetical protein